MKTLFFDIGNVLVFFDHMKMCSQVAQLSQIELSHVVDLMHKYGDSYERGAVSSEQMHNTILEKSGLSLPFDAFMTAMSDIFEPNLPVIEIAKKLKKKGHRLFALSNTCEAHFLYLKYKYDFLSFFDGFVLSYEVQARKPEKKIFKKALEIADCKPYECFYTDDVVEYIQSARELDIDAEPFTGANNLQKQLAERGLL